MILTENQKIMIIVGLVLVLLAASYYKYNKQKNTKSKTEHMDTVSNSDDNSADESDDSEDSGDSDDSSETAVTKSSVVPSSTVVSSVDGGSATKSAVKSKQLIEINRGKNANRSNVRKDVSYGANTYPESLDAPGRVDARGGSGDIDRFFMDGDVENATENREFSPVDEVSDKLAAYVSKKTDEGLLPVEEKDWFEDVTPTRIKNRHLINIYRPVGVNTISTSLKNPSLDIRGNPANPKTVVSPFLNSSIEPDHNIRGLCVE